MGSLVSLVMTDIVDSTRRWNAAEGAMAADLELHDRLIREVVEGAGGSVFKHTGDGMIAVFDDPVAAVGAAAGVQQAIGGAQWQQPEGLRVRAAVHTGVVYPRDGDLFGTAVNKVARLLGACPPGAVLVSGATTALITDRAPEGLSLRPIGPVPLAGFATADETHALSGAGLTPVERASVAAEDRIRGGQLPPIEAELVGRVDELAAIWDAVGRSSVVTLVGVGGMGKTRLALEVAAGAVAAYGGAVWWIDLANATTADAVMPVAMAAVGVRETAGRTPLEAFVDRFDQVAGLVVVDNCEHVITAAREMVGGLANGATEMRVLCTSREALGLRREQLVPVGSLPVDDGMRLFGERATAVRPDLDVVASQPAIERICARLDGIPLAIELAAARCRSMTPAEICALLDDRFRLLRGGRDGAERHRTLQAAVTWSYELLDDDERAVFDQMAVFADGTLIDGLMAVTGYDRYDALDLVDRLVARSMVVAAASPLGTRYHQLETLRHYGEDRLVADGAIAAVRDRHLAWVETLCTGISEVMGTVQAGDGWRRFAVEVDNLRVAVAHAIENGRHHIAQRIVAGVGRCAIHRPAWEVIDWVHPIRLDGEWTEEAALCATYGAYVRRERAGDPGAGYPYGGVPERFFSTSAVVNYTQAVLLLSTGDPRRVLEQLDAAPARPGLNQVQLRALQVLGRFYVASSEGVIDAEYPRFAAESVEVVEQARRSGDEFALWSALAFRGVIVRERDPQWAVQVAEEAVELARRLSAEYLIEQSQSLLISASAAATARTDPASIGEMAALVRQQLLVTVAQHHRFAFGMALPAVTSLIHERDPDTASLLVGWMTLRHFIVSNDGIVQRLRSDPRFDEAAMQRAAEQLEFEQVVKLALAALDRLIADAAADRGDG
jgi:predicted ATPase/class 3 adenylate cyclase